MPVISVVVPCRNYGRYLTEALGCLVGGQTCLGQVQPQMLTDFEAIIVDDASTDDTQAVAQRFAAADGRVKIIHLAQNAGTAAALNAGIAAASGQYVYILSADDMAEPWALERMLAACQAHPHTICYGDLTIVTAGKRVKPWRLTAYDFEKVIHKNPMPCAGVMYPRQAWEEVGGYPEAMRWGREGWAFNVVCGLAGWCGHHIGGQCGYLYRWDGQNRSERTAGNTPQIQPPDGAATWKAFYLGQMRALFPSAYNGEWKTMPGCCGKPIKTTGGGNTPPAKVSKPANLPGKAGFAVVQYVGPSDLDQTYWVGTTRYEFGARKNGYVDIKHLPKLLAMRGKQKEVLFVEVKPEPLPATPQAVPKQPEPALSKAEGPAQSKQEEPVTVDGGPNATGGAQVLAEAHGIDLRTVQGSGDGGRITKRDVQDAIAKLEEQGKEWD